jgi:hypothetical protein
MLIVNDIGNEVVNSELVFALTVVETPEGWIVLAQGVAQWRSVLAAGSKDRCQRALKLITDGVKQRQHIVDLVGVLGQRPEIAVPQPKIVLPGNGEGGRP